MGQMAYAQARLTSLLLDPPWGTNVPDVYRPKNGPIVGDTHRVPNNSGIPLKMCAGEDAIPSILKGACIRTPACVEAWASLRFAPGIRYPWIC